jgi:uncharacterized MAPEG superfamily protein
MASTQASTQIQTAAVVTLIVYVKLLATQITQGTKKGQTGGKGPEDGGTGFSSMGPAAGGETMSTEDAAKLAASRRWDRILGNDLENIPVALIILWSCALVSAESTAFMVLACLFCVSRCLHTLMYMFGKQPFRSLTFAMGVVGTLGMAILTVATVFK